MGDRPRHIIALIGIRKKIGWDLGEATKIGMGPLAARHAPPRGRRPIPEEHFKQVAHVYATGGRIAVEREWTVSKPTAAKWVQRAGGSVSPRPPGRAAV